MLKRNIALIVVIIITISLCSFLIIKKSIDISILLGCDTSIHFSLLTVSSIIGGFMFSGLGLLVGVSGNRLVKELERASKMDRIYNNVIAGIIFCILSIIISLCVIFQAFKFSIALEKILVSAEIITLTVAISCFLLSVIDLRFIIASIHKDSKVVPDSVIEGLKRKMKNKDQEEDKNEPVL